MRGLRQGITALALVGSLAVAPSAAHAIASWNVTGSGAVGIEFVSNAGNTAVDPEALVQIAFYTGDQAQNPYPSIVGTSGTFVETGSGFFDANASDSQDFLEPQYTTPLDPLPGTETTLSEWSFSNSGFAVGPGGFAQARSYPVTGVRVSNGSDADLTFRLNVTGEADASGSVSDPALEGSRADVLWRIFHDGPETNEDVTTLGSWTLRSFANQQFKTGLLGNQDDFPASFGGSFDFTVAGGDARIVYITGGTFGEARSDSTIVPVPAALPMLGMALVGLGLMARRRNKPSA